MSKVTVTTGCYSESICRNSTRNLVIDSTGVYHVAYAKTDGGKYNIFYTKSIDGGDTWLTPYQITSDVTYSQEFPTIIVDSFDNTHIVWYGCHASSTTKTQARYIKHTFSDDTWSSITNLTSSSSVLYPSIYCDGGNNLHLTYTCDNNNQHIWYMRYDNQSKTWSTPSQIDDTPTNHKNLASSMQVDSNGFIHVVWYGKWDAAGAGSAYNIRYAVSDDDGNNWSHITVTSVNYTQNNANIIIDDNNNVHIFWDGRTSSAVYNVYYSKTTNRGSSFIIDKQALTADASYSQQYPSCVIDNDLTINCLFCGKYTGYTSYNQLRCIASSDNGTTWGSITNITTSKAQDQLYADTIFTLHPIIYDVGFNRPKKGYAMIWLDGTNLVFSKSSDYKPVVNHR